ncbi:MAG TPA: CaiB/BaiF CoA-transferase family protein [bacterium]
MPPLFITLNLMTPLKNIVVLDLTRLLPGPLCTLFLADLGAEVIKIEDTGTGDYIRWLPPLLDDNSAIYHALNRNKKSIKLDLKNDAGKEIFRRLAKNCDLAVEGFRPGTMDRLGVGYASLMKDNPRLIYCAITGYGQDGPYRDRAGHDINYISVAGLLGTNGVNGGAPHVPGVPIADIGGGGLLGMVTILTALYQREKTGKGQFLDVSMMDGSIVFLMHHIAEVYGRGAPFRRGGETLTGGLACFTVYKTKDGKFISVGALEPKFWTNLLSLLGREDLLNKQFIYDEQPFVKKELQEIFSQKTRNEWIELFGDKDVCCEPVYELDEIENDPHVRHRGIIKKIRLKNGSESVQVRTPVRGTGIAEARYNPAPAHGEHTEEILKRIGYNENDIAGFREKGII